MKFAAIVWALCGDRMVSCNILIIFFTGKSPWAEFTQLQFMPIFSPSSILVPKPEQSL